MKVLITGGTGFIGKKLIYELYAQAEIIYVLVRPQSFRKAEQTFIGLNKIKLIVGDVFANDVCHSIDDLELLANSVTDIVHLAAKYDLAMTAYDAYTNNVIGVQNILTLARRMNHLQFFHHISSYSVNSHCDGLVLEDAIDLKANYSDHYAKSKMQGEFMVRTMDLGNVRKRIYRPGIVIGDSMHGEIEKVDGPYYFLRLLYNMKDYLQYVDKLNFFPLPYGKKTEFPIIPVDVLVDWLKVAITEPNHHEKIKCYHFVSKKPVYLHDFVQRFLKLNGMESKLLRLKESKLFEKILPHLGMPKELLSYMYSKATYDVSARQKDFPDLEEFNVENFENAILDGSSEYFSQELEP
jgi:thioester reductase-like protein